MQKLSANGKVDEDNNLEIELRLLLVFLHVSNLRLHLQGKDSRHVLLVRPLVQKLLKRANTSNASTLTLKRTTMKNETVTTAIGDVPFL